MKRRSDIEARGTRTIYKSYEYRDICLKDAKGVSLISSMDDECQEAVNFYAVVIDA